MEWLEVKNWQKYQHYKNRRPPWIKLHASVLNDRDFSLLSCASKGLLMQLWILASENDGKVPYDLNEIQFRLRDKTIKNSDFNVLISKGFFKNCKHMLSSACPETETETETETEKKKKINKRKVLPDFLPHQLWEDFLEHRRKLRRPMSDKAQELLIEKLIVLKDKGENSVELLETALERGWLSVYPVNVNTEDDYEEQARQFKERHKNDKEA